jgi:valyl-tRNA synthetase
MINLDDYDINLMRDGRLSLNSTQKQHLKDLQKLVKETTKLMDEFKFYIAAEKIYHYFWHTFCDKIIEESKLALAKASANKEKQATQYMLLEILKDSLKLLHPFMPFITEEIYQNLPIKNKKKCLMVEEWPA